MNEYILNPETNRKVKRNTRKGKEIMKKYFGGGSAVTGPSLSPFFVCFAQKETTSRTKGPSQVASSHNKYYKGSSPTQNSTGNLTGKSTKNPVCVLPLIQNYNANSCSHRNGHSVLSGLSTPENYDIDFNNALKFVYGQVQQHCGSELDIDKDIFLIENGSPPPIPPLNLTSGSDCSFDMNFSNSTTNQCGVPICHIENIKIDNCVQQGTQLIENRDTLNNILKDFLQDVLNEICKEIIGLKDVKAMSLFQGVLAGLLVESIVDLCNQSGVATKICNNKYAKIVGNVVFKMKMADQKASVLDTIIIIGKTVAKVESDTIPLEGRIKGVIVDEIKKFILKKKGLTQFIVDQP